MSLPDGNTAALREHERVEAENERIIEEYFDEAHALLLSNALNDEALLREGMANFSDHEMLVAVRPLLSGENDALLGRMVREVVRVYAHNSFTEADVRELALKLGGGPVPYVEP